MSAIDDSSEAKKRALHLLKMLFGDVALSALTAEDTTDLLLNEDGVLWRESLGGRPEPIGTVPADRAITILKAVAGYYGKELTEESPLLEAVFPIDGSRFAGQIPPVVEAPTFAIRRKAVRVFTLRDYVKYEVMTGGMCGIIERAVARRLNILVVGGTGSGKTTLVNAINNEMVASSPTDRVVSMEDTRELQVSAKNKICYKTSPTVSLEDLLQATLRMRPDRVLVGEVRGKEALTMLDAWNTGHEGGAATIHANSAVGGLRRLETLISRNANPPNPVQPFIAEVAHLLVFIARTEEGRRVKEIVRVRGFESGRYVLKHLEGR